LGFTFPKKTLKSRLQNKLLTILKTKLMSENEWVVFWTIEATLLLIILITKTKDE